MNRRKILFVLPNFHSGGSEKLVFDIIKTIDKNTFEPHLCVFFTGDYEPEYRKLNYPLHIIHENVKRSKITTVKFLNSLIAKNEIDVVNTHHPLPLIHGFLSFRIFNRVKLWVHTEHTRLDMHPHLNNFKILTLEKFCLKAVDYAVGISQGICDHFKNDLAVADKKIVKIVNGVDIEKYSLPDNSKTELKAKYKNDLSIKDNQILIGLFANFREQKNHLCLVKAASILKKNKGVQNFKIIFAGSGPMEKECQRIAENEDLKENVIFLGVRFDIPELMNLVDIYCLPSLYEGLPISLMEAMASQKTIVATNVIGTSEIAVNNKNALLVPSDSPLGLANALERVILNKILAIDLSIQARKDIEAYSFSNTIRKYEALFLK